MDIGELISAVVFILFAVTAVVRRISEGRQAEERKEQPQWTTDDLPEETRRMLFGDAGPQKARPVERTQQLDPYEEPQTVARQQRASFEPKTARPKQGAPRPPSPPIQRREPEPVREQVAQRHREEVMTRPTVEQRPPTPPRRVPQAQPAIPQMRQVRAEQEQRPVQQRPPQAPRREPPMPPRVPAQQAQQQAAQTTRPRRPVQQKPRPAPVRAGKWLASKDDVRRAIILTEILGPPKSLQ